MTNTGSFLSKKWQAGKVDYLFEWAKLGIAAQKIKQLFNFFWLTGS